METEMKRMAFDTQNIWRVSDINSNYKCVTDNTVAVKCLFKKMNSSRRLSVEGG